MLVIAAGLLAVLYGAVQTASLLRASPGNAKMQEIAAAIQEGATAYLRRQYMTIAMVGVVILIALERAIDANFRRLARKGGAAGRVISARARQYRAPSSHRFLHQSKQPQLLRVR